MYSQRPFVDRFRESNEIRRRYPDKTPVIIERAQIAKDMPYIKKNRYLVPGTFTFGQFIYVIRRQLELPSDKALFIFVDNTLVPTSTFMSEIYKEYMSPDGFVYMRYTGESTFGTR